MRCVRRIERLLVFVIAALAVLVVPTAVPLFAQEAWADEAAAAPASAARASAASARDLPATGDGTPLVVAALVLAGLCALAAARGLHRMGER